MHDRVNLPGILDQALDAVLGVTGAAAGEIFLLDETAGEVVLAAHRGPFPEPLQETVRFRLGDGFPGRVALSGKPLITTDFTNDLRLLPRWVVEAGISSLACVPLKAMGRVVGTMDIAAPGSRPWSDAHVQLLTSVSDQLGVAITSARIYSEASFERQRAEAMAEIAQATSTLELNQVLRLALDKAMETLAVPVGAIYLWDEVAGDVGLVAHRGLSPAYIFGADHIRPGEGIVGRVLSSGLPELIDDVVTSPLVARPIVREEGIRSALVVPLQAKGRVIGAIFLATRVLQHFTLDQTALLVAVGQQMALAIENARLLQHLSRAKQEWEATFDSITDGIALLDEGGTIQRANRAFAAFWGRPIPGLIGTTWHDLAVHLDESSPCPHCEVARTKEPAVAETHLLASRRNLAVSAFPVSSQENLPGATSSGIIIVIHDISERKRTEEEQVRLQAALEKAAREWHLTFDSVDSVIMILAADGRVIRLNRAAKDLLGKSYQDILGQNIETLGSNKLWAKATELWRHVRRTRSSASGQTRDESSGKTWDITGNLLIEAGVEDDRIILLARDITRVVELQTSLHRSETMAAIGSLAAGLCHEVRTPLFGISATLDAFEARFGSQEEYAEYFAILRRELARMNDLMRDLLDYSRPPSQSFSTDSIENVIAQAVHTCGTLAKLSNVKVANSTRRRLPPVLMDRRRLLQVFQNLIENAIQHSPRGGVVAVAAKVLVEEGRPWIDCTIMDSGPGFREEDLPRIFEPFYTKRREGTGLGLSIVQRIVEEHGGRIGAGNRPEGGALVTVRFACALK